MAADSSTVRTLGDAPSVTPWGVHARADLVSRRPLFLHQHQLALQFARFWQLASAGHISISTEFSPSLALPYFYLNRPAPDYNSPPSQWLVIRPKDHCLAAMSRRRVVLASMEAGALLLLLVAAVFLLCLCVPAVRAAPAGAEVTEFPGFPGELPSKHYAG